MVDTHPAGARRLQGGVTGSRRGLVRRSRGPMSIATSLQSAPCGTRGWRRLGPTNHNKVYVGRRLGCGGLQAIPSTFRACAPPGAGPANCADHRTLLRYPVVRNPVTAVIVSQPGVHHRGVEQRKRGSSVPAVACTGIHVMGSCRRGPDRVDRIHGNTGRPRPNRRRRFVHPAGVPQFEHLAPTRSMPR
jgi:hypothetical protein